MLPTLYVDYGDDCSFTMRADGGVRLDATTPPGNVIPPGSYQVVLDAPANAPACPLDFQLRGPGVQVEWEFGGEALDAMTTATLQPSSTYVAADLRDPARGRAVFSTAASGSSASLVTQPAATAPGKGQTVQGIVGSAVAPSRGTLRAALSAAGSLTLSTRGRRVSKLKPGRYTLVVADASPRRGLTLQKAGGRVARLTGAAFVGTRKTTVVLVPGAWFFDDRRVTVP